ncbi:G-protein coupled receptor 143-like [Penaeus indicus]|uniref:G-protein coupled receptor 143-like n=1 Tax=Penaeus indicus TaxID=29960 RepID=UPI00300D80BA
MASPTIESLCCLSSTNAFSKDFLIDFQSVPYNAISILASLFGMAGAIYQVLPRTLGNGANGRGGRFFKTRGRLIIRWLAFADLLAAFGILVRSASWLADDTFGSKADDSRLGQSMCIITSVIIHYFYTATYCWTFLYALDVKLVMHERRISHRMYHAVAWSVPLILCLMGLLILYLPDLNCHSQAVNPYLRFLPNYLSTFIPIVIVMIGNPILYCIAFSRVEKQIMSARGRFTHSERRVVDGLRKKFLLINGVFYLCWLPNIINGIVLWTSWNNLPKTFIITVWYLMAILNPLQAVFNSMVYRSWEAGSGISKPSWFPARLWPKHSSQQLEVPNVNVDDLYNDQVPEQEESVEESPQRSVSMRLSHERTPLLHSLSKDGVNQSQHEVTSSQTAPKAYT